MIAFKEILGTNSIADVPIKIQQNIDELLKCVNLLRADWGKPLRVTSGLRTMNDHLRIYSEMNPPRHPPNVPMQSNHLKGLACDFADPDGSLYAWALLNETKLEHWGLWCEAATKNWLHVQCVPYGSYKPRASRFFKP